MKKELNGRELAGYIKERQAHVVRRMIQAEKIYPKLAIVQVKDDPVINTYVRLKKSYGSDIKIDVRVHEIDQSGAGQVIETLNNDKSVHGIIVQLPLTDISETDELLQLVKPEKDVDALGGKTTLFPATPQAILWLLGGYGVDLKGKKIAIVGQGKLVGAPLTRQLMNDGHDVAVIDEHTENMHDILIDSDIIITATGKHGVITSNDIKQGAVVVDAGVASEEGKTVGDLSSDVYERDDLIITPTKGGVGPLTVCALFENVILAAQNQKNN